MSGSVIGREREIAAANDFLDGVAGGSRSLLLVGEPGVGKTTVWSAILGAAAARGYGVLAAHPTEAESSLAFGVLTDLLAEIDDTALDGLSSVQRDALETALRRRERDRAVDPTAISLAMVGVLRHLSERSPVVVAVDDLQWVDAPSLRVLGFAFRRLAEAPVGLVVTVRSGLEGELESLASPAGEAVARIEIGGLDERALARLVLERTGRSLAPPQLRRLADLSGGNPFYALELASTGDPDLTVPESLASTLRARLATLSAEARSAGLTAATLGRFDETIPGGVAGRGLDELRTTGVVVIRGGTAVFAHPLLASTLLELHTTEERRAVHRSLATVVEDPDERAFHLGRGSDRPNETVAVELERAADRLDARGAPETGATLAERAAALTPTGHGAAATRRLIRAADLYQAAGEGGTHVLPMLQDLAGTLPAGDDHARVLVRLGWLGAQMDTIPASEAIAYQHRALTECGDAKDVVSAAHAVLARLLGNAGDYRAAHDHAERAVEAEPAVRSNDMFPSPLGELALARFMTGNGFDRALFTKGIARVSTVSTVVEPYQSPSLQLALGLLYTGELGPSRDLLCGLRERSIELGRVRSTAGCALHLVDLEVRAGRLEAAEEHADEFVHLDRQLRGERSGEWYPSGLVAVHRGRVDDARRILNEGIEYSHSIESTIWLAHQLGALGHLELALGNPEAARDALVELIPILRGTGLGEWSVHPVHPDAIEALVALGALDAAVPLVDELEEYGRRLDRPWGLATAARSAALVASARGATEEALEAVERALVEHERLDWPLERARTLLVSGRILRRLARRRVARERLVEARAILTALGSPLWLAAVDAEDRQLGGRRSSGDELTPAETRVAELAGQGLRNAEIAARLHVTPKTVETTLSHVYRKLGVRSRTELARRLAERDPASPPGEPGVPAPSP